MADKQEMWYSMIIIILTASFFTPTSGLKPHAIAQQNRIYKDLQQLAATDYSCLLLSQAKTTTKGLLLLYIPQKKVCSLSKSTFGVLLLSVGKLWF